MRTAPSPTPDRRRTLGAVRGRPSRGLVAALLACAVVAAAAPPAGAAVPDPGAARADAAVAQPSAEATGPAAGPAATPAPTTPAAPSGAPAPVPSTTTPAPVPPGPVLPGPVLPGPVPQGPVTQPPSVPAPPAPGTPRPVPAPSYFQAPAAAAVAAAAVPEPSVPILTAPEALSRYQGQVTCDPGEKPGTQRLRSLLRASYGKANAGGISRACSTGGESQHKEGRAYDWALDVNNPADRATAEQFITWAVGPDGAGVPAGNAARLGVQYIIWNRQIWQSWSNSWKPYTGESPHTDHIHISLSWDGAFARTSWWTGTAVTRVDHGPCQVYEGVLVAPYSAPNYTRCPPPINPATLPTGRIDQVYPGYGTVSFRGWTRDSDTSSPLAVHAYVDGAFGGVFTAGVPRGDVGAHGFEITLPMSPGTHQVCLYAINVGAGGSNPAIGCPSVSRVSGSPTGTVEQLALVPGGLRLSGWTLDPDSPAPLSAHVYVNGWFAGAWGATGWRPDVAAAFPGWGADHGFTGTLSTPPGPQQVCVYAINTGAGSVNPSVGCRTVTSLGTLPTGNFEAAAGSAGAVSVTGWALDPDAAGSIGVHVYVDGVSRVARTADGARADVARAYPGWSAAKGWSASVGGLSAGSHQVCVYAINTGAGGQNPSLGCRTVQVG